MLLVSDESRFDLEGELSPISGQETRDLKVTSRLAQGLTFDGHILLTYNKLKIGDEFEYYLDELPKYFKLGDRFRIEFSSQYNLNWYWYREGKLLYFCGLPQEPVKTGPTTDIQIFSNFTEEKVQVQSIDGHFVLGAEESTQLGEYFVKCVYAPQESTGGGGGIVYLTNQTELKEIFNRQSSPSWYSDRLSGTTKK